MIRTIRTYVQFFGSDKGDGFAGLYGFARLDGFVQRIPNLFLVLFGYKWWQRLLLFGAVHSTVNSS